MRTTVAIDDDVLAAAKRLSTDRSVSLGRVVSDLLRRALDTDCPTTTVNGLWVLDPGPRSPLVRRRTVSALLDEEVAR